MKRWSLGKKKVSILLLENQNQGRIGYVVMDLEELRAVSSTLRTRVLY